MKSFLAAPGIEFDFIDPDDSTLRETVPGNTYEPAVVHLLLKIVKPGDTVIDVGALYGYFSCFCARIDPSVQVYAFDPCRAYCDVVEENARLNRLDNLHAVPLALADTSGEWQFKEKTLLAGTRDASRGETNDNQPKNDAPTAPEPRIKSEMQVKVHPLQWAWATVAHVFRKLVSPPPQASVVSIRYDDWKQQNSVKARIAKIDVHGAEVVVLRGMTQSLLEDFEHLIVEVHRTDMLVDGNYQELIGMLLESGFTLYEMMDFRSDKKWHIKPMEAGDIEKFVNPAAWSLKNKIEMRMIYAAKGEKK